MTIIRLKYQISGTVEFDTNKESFKEGFPDYSPNGGTLAEYEQLRIDEGDIDITEMVDILGEAKSVQLEVFEVEPNGDEIVPGEYDPDWDQRQPQFKLDGDQVKHVDEDDAPETDGHDASRFKGGPVEQYNNPSMLLGVRDVELPDEDIEPFGANDPQEQ